MTTIIINSNDMAEVYSQYRSKGYEPPVHQGINRMDGLILLGIKNYLATEHDWHVVTMPLGEVEEGVEPQKGYVYLLTHSFLTQDTDWSQLFQKPRFATEPEALVAGLREALAYIG